MPRSHLKSILALASLWLGLQSNSGAFDAKPSPDWTTEIAGKRYGLFGIRDGNRTYTVVCYGARAGEGFTEIDVDLKKTATIIAVASGGIFVCGLIVYARSKRHRSQA